MTGYKSYKKSLIFWISSFVSFFQNCQVTFKGRELNIRSGNFVVDTANGILPEGWVLG